MNNCTFIGRCGKDAVTRLTQGGKAVTGWSVAVDTGFGDSKTTTWVDCNAWGERYTKIAEYIKKGDRIGVCGEIGTREHDGKTYVTLNVREVTLLGNKEAGAGERSGTGKGKPAAPADHGKPTLDDDEIPFAPRGKRSHFE